MIFYILLLVLSKMLGIVHQHYSVLLLNQPHCLTLLHPLSRTPSSISSYCTFSLTFLAHFTSQSLSLSSSSSPIALSLLSYLLSLLSCLSSISPLSFVSSLAPGSGGAWRAALLRATIPLRVNTPEYVEWFVPGGPTPFVFLHGTLRLAMASALCCVWRSSRLMNSQRHPSPPDGFLACLSGGWDVTTPPPPSGAFLFRQLGGEPLPARCYLSRIIIPSPSSYYLSRVIVAPPHFIE